MIAKDLYRAIIEVERLEKQLISAPFEKREALENMLRKAKAEERQIRAMLEAKKEPSRGSRFHLKR